MKKRAVPSRLAGLLGVVVLLSGCSPGEALHPLDRVAFQRAVEPAEGAWQPLESLVKGPGSEVPVWYRVEVPALESPNPAIVILGAPWADVVTVGERRVELKGLHIVSLGPGPAVVTVRAGPMGAFVVPKFVAGPEGALWSLLLSKGLAPFVVGMMMVLAGLLLLSAGLRAGAERAYRGLGLFLLSIGVITVINTPLRHLLSLRGDALIYAHELATTLYPVGFADFVLGVFGDGPRGLLRRGLRLFAVYAVVAWGLHFTGVLHILTGRAPAAWFIVVFLVQAVVLATRRTRAGDRSAPLFLAGIVGLLVVSVPDLLDAAGLVRFDFNSVPYAILLFSIAMMGVVARQHADAREAQQQAAKDLAAKVDALEASNREIQSLNQELRHQIAERSRQLGDALQGGALVTVASPLQQGEVIDGRYRVLDTLGRGGMGSVHLVERQTDRRKFALKIMSGAADAVSGARFAREAEIAARVADEHLVRVVDVGGSGTGRLYIVMELIDGHSLEEDRPKFGDVAWALPVLEQVLRGVKALHAAGVVHRDLKPANVLLSVTPEGRLLAKISDFGISRLGEPAVSEVADGDAVAQSAGAPMSAVSGMASRHAAEAAPRSAGASMAAVSGIARGDVVSATPRSANGPVAASNDEDLGATFASANTPAANAPAAVLADDLGGTLASINPAAQLADELGGTLASINPPAATPRDSSPQLTGLGALMGTPAYMAPELARGAHLARPASDMFALGLIAYELLAGHVAWSRAPVLSALAGETLTPPAPLPTSVPAQVSALIFRCLDADATRRPSAVEVLAALEDGGASTAENSGRRRAH